MNQWFLPLILVFTFLIYSPALRHGFVNLDDPSHVTENPKIRSLSPENIQHIFTSTVQRTYIPLTIFSFALEYQIAGTNPFFYHLNNVLLHLLVVFLLFRLGTALGLNTLASGTAAFIFALHPMHVESVAWVTERKDVLYSAFYLGAMLWYLRFVKSNHPRDYALSLLMAFLSILAKPMALSLPLLLLLCDWFIKGRLTKADWLNKVPFGLVIIPTAWATYSINAGIVGQGGSPGILHPFWAAAFYLKKFAWPSLLVPHYLPPLPADIFRFEYWSSVLIVIACFAAFIKCPDRWLRFSLLWFIFSIFFLLNFNHERVVQVVADRYMYLPSAGFCFLAGYAVEKIRGKNSMALILAAVFLFLSIKTVLQVGVWKDSLTLWNYTIKHTPTSYLAFNNRGRVYEHRKQWDLAKADYLAAIRFNPKYEKPYKNLAMIYEGLGNPHAAFEYYTKAIAVKANYFEAYNNRALLFEQKGDLASALNDYNKAIASNPKYVLGYANRGALLLKIGRLEESLNDLNTALKLKPDFAAAYLNRAINHFQMNFVNEAREDCQKAARFNSSDPTIKQICASMYEKMR